MATCPVVLVSAIASGQGKTTVTAALARRFRRDGLRVRVFKAGPDFLDPMLLAQASGAPVYNLDLWMVGEADCRRLLARAAHEADVVLVEGVMGLYDGTPSSADLSRALGLPVLVVVDASAMAQTVGAVVSGLRSYGPVDLMGVVANRTASARHVDMVAEALRAEPLLAALPRQAQALPERHLGLVTASEIAGLDGLLDGLADAVELRQAPAQWPGVAFPEMAAGAQAYQPLQGRTIAIARDAAFAFLYPANLDCLQALGATLAWFSPLADEPVPAGADAIYLPGGYPELHAATLAGAMNWQRSIRAMHAAGVPIVAECGGLMAIAASLVDGDGRQWPMAGLLPGTARMQGRLAALGMQSLATPWGALRGHTFHYSVLEGGPPPSGFTRRQRDDADGEAVYAYGRLHASYFHAYFPSQPRAVAAWFGATS